MQKGINEKTKYIKSSLTEIMYNSKYLILGQQRIKYNNYSYPDLEAVLQNSFFIKDNSSRQLYNNVCEKIAKEKYIEYCKLVDKAIENEIEDEIIYVRFGNIVARICLEEMLLSCLEDEKHEINIILNSHLERIRKKGVNNMLMYINKDKENELYLYREKFTKEQIIVYKISRFPAIEEIKNIIELEKTTLDEYLKRASKYVSKENLEEIERNINNNICTIIEK